MEKSFNTDSSKQTQKVIFSRKLKKVPHPPLVFNSGNVSQSKSQKHLDNILDSELIYEEHCKMLLKVVSTTFLLVCFTFVKENNCEAKKNVLYFTSKALCGFEIIKF